MVIIVIGKLLAAAAAGDPLRTSPTERSPPSFSVQRGNRSGFDVGAQHPEKRFRRPVEDRRPKNLGVRVWEFCARKIASIAHLSNSYISVE
jgi:hypothetical protein